MYGMYSSRWGSSFFFIAVDLRGLTVNQTPSFCLASRWSTRTTQRQYFRRGGWSVVYAGNPQTATLPLKKYLD